MISCAKEAESVKLQAIRHNSFFMGKEIKSCEIKKAAFTGRLNKWLRAAVKGLLAGIWHSQ